MDIIKAMNLKKYYTSDTYEVRALDGVSLTVEEGEFIAVVGTSGCGKTTLMNILGGLDTPDFGGVWIRNTSLKDLNKEERTIFRRRNIGFVFQQYNLIPSLSIRENIVLPMRLDGKEIDVDFFNEIVETLGLKDNSYEGTEVELEVNALAPQDRQILFGQLYENGFLIKTADDKAPEVAVGWRERKLNGKYDFKWLYAGKFAEGISEEASTKEGKLSPTTKSIKGSFYERSLDNAYEISVDESNLVKENTKAAEAIKSWFSKVQEKNDAAA